MSVLYIPENRLYLIIPYSQINLIDFSEVLEDSIETLVTSVNGMKTFVKWDGETPSFVSNLTNTEGPYPHNEFLQILSTSEWRPQQG